MKTQTSLTSSLCRINFWLVVFGLFAGQNSFAASFSLAPAAVSNTYSGTISLSVGGLTNGETVVVQKFLDLNTNGVIDAGDYLVQQFNLTDGANFAIGGVVNSNVPGDANPAPGSITATLNFRNGDFVQNIIGNFLYKLSSPAGNFAPLTNLLSVTNFPFGQKLTGHVLNNGTNVPNAVVILFPPPRGGDHGPGTPVAGIVVDSSGGYTVQLPPGTYLPLAVRNNFVANFSDSSPQTLGNGSALTVDLTLLNATQSITGKYVDAADVNIGLPGIFVPIASEDGLIAVCFTDSNGNFIGQVQSGQWDLGSDDSGLILHGYVGSQNGTHVSAGSTGITLSYPKATALFYGQIRDTLGHPLANVDIEANDNNGQYDMDAYSDINGYYCLAAIGGLGNNDLWQLQASQGNNLTNYIFSQPSFNQAGGTNLPFGYAVQQDFAVLPVTGNITGNLQYQGTNVANVAVSANGQINGVNYFANANADDNGNYSLAVADGTWSVSVSCQGGDNSLDSLFGNGNYLCPNNQNVVVAGNTVVANFMIQPCGGVLILTPSPLPGGLSGVYYSAQFNAESCNGNFNWSVNDPAHLPPGLTFYSGGVLNGTPTASGTYNFSIHAQDNSGSSTNVNFSLTISQPNVSFGAAAKISGSQFQFQLNGSPNQNYTLQMSTNLAVPNWISLFTTNNATNGLLLLDDPHATNQQRFYRIMIGP